MTRRIRENCEACGPVEIDAERAALVVPLSSVGRSAASLRWECPHCALRHEQSLTARAAYLASDAGVAWMAPPSGSGVSLGDEQSANDEATRQ